MSTLTDAERESLTSPIPTGSTVRELAEQQAAELCRRVTQIVTDRETALREEIAWGQWCHEEVSGERCNEPAEFILWGKLLPREALGPRCYQHAVNHTHHSMPARVDQWAVFDLRARQARP